MLVSNSLFFTQFVSDKDVQKFKGGISSDVYFLRYGIGDKEFLANCIEI